MNENVTTAVAGENMTGQLDYKQYDPTRPFSRFYKVGKWWKG